MNGPPPPITWTDDPWDEKVTLGWADALLDGLSDRAKDWVRERSEWGTLGRMIIDDGRQQHTS